MKLLIPSWDYSKSSEEKLQMILAKIEEGCSIIFATAYKRTEIKQKHIKQWENYGKPLLKVSGKNLVMATGKSYTIMDGCAIFFK